MKRHTTPGTSRSKLLKTATTAALSLLTVLSFGQNTSYTRTIVYKHGHYTGQDATVWQLIGSGGRDCIPTGQTNAPSNTNYGDDIMGTFMGWTWNDAGCPNGTTRFYMRFPQLSLLAANEFIVGHVTITSARLRLFGVPQANSNIYWGNNVYPNSPFVANNNSGVIRKLAAGAGNAASLNNWNEHGITWNNAGNVAFDLNAPPVLIPQTNSRFSNNLTVDVTDIVARVVRETSGYQDPVTLNWIPADRFSNNGFMLQLQNEAFYRSQGYCSSDYPTPQLWPELEVTYAVTSGCGLTFSDVTFRYENNISSPLQFTFNANSPGFIATGYSWYINPGTTPNMTGPALSTNPSFTYTFPAPGQYCVALRSMCSMDVIYSTAIITIDNAGFVTQQPQVVHQADNGFIQNPEVVGADAEVHQIPRGDDPLMLQANATAPVVTPNPTSGNWKVKLAVPEATTATLVIYDALGKKVSSEVKTLQTGANTFEIAAEHLRAGLYFMELKGGAVNMREKLVKQ